MILIFIAIVALVIKKESNCFHTRCFFNGAQKSRSLETIIVILIMIIIIYFIEEA